MLGKSLQTRDRPETLFRVCRCRRKGSPEGAYLSAGPGRGIQQAALTTVLYVYGTPDNRTRTIVYV